MLLRFIFKYHIAEMCSVCTGTNKPVSYDCLVNLISRDEHEQEGVGWMGRGGAIVEQPPWVPRRPSNTTGSFL